MSRASPCTGRSRSPPMPASLRTAGAWSRMAAAGTLLWVLAAPSGSAAAQEPQRWEPTRTPDVVYVPTAPEVVDRMLEMAAVGADDVLYDLGSGDGRIPITAARRWGTRGVGIELKPDLVALAEITALQEGVADKVRFMVGDLFELDLSEATVITLYLLPTLNMRLRDRLQAMPAGTRIVSHDYDMGSWKADRIEHVGNATLYLWVVR